MAWQMYRTSGPYYTRSVRRGGKVVKEFYGKGPAAELAAQLHAAERDRRKQQREDRKAQLQQQLQVRRPITDFCVEAELLTRARLIAAGWHLHKRHEWRRRCGTRRARSKSSIKQG